MKCNLLPVLVKRKCLHTIPNPLWVNPSIMKSGPGLGIKIKVLNSVLILTFADQIKWCLCRFFSKLYLLLLTSICLKYVKTKLKNCMILKSSPTFWDFYVLLSHNTKLVIFTQAHKWYRIILHSLSININFNETSFTKVFINSTRWKRSFSFTDHIAGFSLVALNLVTYYTCLIESYLFENGHSYKHVSLKIFMHMLDQR